MDKLNHYRQCVQILLEEYAQVKPFNDQIEEQLIFDTQRDRYQVVDLGWDGDRRIYTSVIHIDIKDGKIWIQRNQTDRLFSNELIKMGVPPQDIVLGLHPPYLREYTGLGVA